VYMREARSETAVWTEVPLDAEASLSCSLATAIADGLSVLLVHGFATESETCALFEAGSAQAAAVAAGRVSSQESGKLSLSLALRLEHSSAPMVSKGRVRMPIAGLESCAARLVCDQLLLRAIELVDRVDASLAHELFDVSSDAFVSELRASGQPVYANPGLRFTHNEPAVNLYRVGGAFEPHRDLQALTVLVPLVGSESFEGGGTAFWSHSAASPQGVEATPPSLVLTPPRGTALLFGGDLMHAGLPVSAGERGVFVASFSRCAARSSAQLGTEGEQAHEREAHVRLEVRDEVRKLLERMY
jgi:hypothetical protein